MSTECMSWKKLTGGSLVRYFNFGRTKRLGHELPDHASGSPLLREGKKSFQQNKTKSKYQPHSSNTTTPPIYTNPTTHFPPSTPSLTDSKANHQISKWAGSPPPPPQPTPPTHPPRNPPPTAPSSPPTAPPAQNATPRAIPSSPVSIKRGSWIVLRRGRRRSGNVGGWRGRWGGSALLVG